jgi:hypothetical protein
MTMTAKHSRGDDGDVPDSSGPGRRYTSGNEDGDPWRATAAFLGSRRSEGRATPGKVAILACGAVAHGPTTPPGLAPRVCPPAKSSR